MTESKNNQETVKVVTMAISTPDFDINTGASNAILLDKEKTDNFFQIKEPYDYGPGYSPSL